MGEADTTVPVEESRELADARPDLVRLVVVEGAGHVQSWNVIPQRYGDVVSRFLRDCGEADGATAAELTTQRRHQFGEHGSPCPRS